MRARRKTAWFFLQELPAAYYKEILKKEHYLVLVRILELYHDDFLYPGFNIALQIINRKTKTKLIIPYALFQADRNVKVDFGDEIEKLS
ncbi:unnamed protein product [Amoebophrya sp. A120]|nr:unnamed protein product [Amoebophrya sp. A120]|eukprot:GSA120T00010863001.1